MPDLADQLPTAVPDRITVVYAAGKSGTRTLIETIRAACSEDWVAEVRRLRSDLGEYHGWVQTHQVSGRRPVRTHDPLVSEFIRGHPDLPVRLLVPVRDPVAAAVSSYFWNYPLRYGESAPLPDDGAIASAIADGAYATRPDYFTGWLDFELAAFTGIDPYAVPFDRRTGYLKLVKGRFTIVIVRVEDIDRVAPSALASIEMRVPNLGPRQHDAVGQRYGAAYTRFKAQPRLCAEWVEEQLATRFAVHFYDPEERRRIAARWSAS